MITHEVGHLKCRKTAVDYLGNLSLILLLVGLIVLLPDVELLQTFNLWICGAFNLQQTSYYLMIGTSLDIISLGYEEELKNMFMKVGGDELMDVNPALLLEFLYRDHPGMYNRIKVINHEKRSMV